MSEIDLMSYHLKQITAHEFMKHGINFLRFKDGDIWINGELVATYEGIIE